MFAFIFGLFGLAFGFGYENSIGKHMLVAVALTATVNMVNAPLGVRLVLITWFIMGFVMQVCSSVLIDKIQISVYGE